MSYCVHCGVELDETARLCPLCKTPVMDPAKTENPEAKPPFPRVTEHYELQSNIKFVAGAASALLAMAMIICLVIDRATSPGLQWSIIADLSMLMFWIMAVAPVFLVRPNLYALTLIDAVTMAGFLYIIQFIFSDAQWYMPLALPLIIGGALCVLLTIAMVRLRLLRKLTLISAILVVSGGYLVFFESRLDVYLTGLLHLDWSWIVFGILFSIALLLAIIDTFQTLKLELKKRFHI